MSKNGIAREIVGWVKSFAIAIIFAFVISNTVVVNAKVISSSMESTVMTDSRVMGSRLTYMIGEPERFDIILFDFPDDESPRPFLKRIIGLPNETVEIKNGKVYINDSGVPLDDSFVNETPRGNFGPFHIPDNSYFVMGDNRNNSWDSKNWTHPFVAKDKILGKVYIEYFPKPKLLD